MCAFAASVNTAAVPAAEVTVTNIATGLQVKTTTAHRDISGRVGAANARAEFLPNTNSTW